MKQITAALLATSLVATIVAFAPTQTPKGELSLQNIRTDNVTVIASVGKAAHNWFVEVVL